jgi:hypothetical protein
VNADNISDLARKVEEIKMRKKVERQQQREAIRRAKQVRGKSTHFYTDYVIMMKYT